MYYRLFVRKCKEWDLIIILSKFIRIEKWLQLQFKKNVQFVIFHPDIKIPIQI